MTAPFTFGKIAYDSNFTNRENESLRLTTNFVSGINTILISPRRWGKSSLVVKSAKLAQKKDKQLKFVFIDLFNVRTEEDFYILLAKNVLQQSNTKAEEIIEKAGKFLGRLIPNLSFSPELNNEFNISFNDFPIIAVGKNYTTDIFSEVIYQNQENENILVRTYDNIGTSKETYIRGLVGIPPGGAYFFALGAQYNLNDYDGYYQGEPLQYVKGSWRFFTFHVLKLFGDTKLTMSGFMMVNGQLGFLELENFGGINLGLRQSFFDNKLSISINARDLLKTMNVRFKIDQGGISTFGNRYTDNQRFGIKIHYKFGLSKKKESENMFKFEEMQ